MVRLKEKVENFWKATFQIFQFHYGAIKGVVTALVYVKSTLFQFHYGAIKGDILEF